MAGVPRAVSRRLGDEPPWEPAPGLFPFPVPPRAPGRLTAAQVSPTLPLPPHGAGPGLPHSGASHLLPGWVPPAATAPRGLLSTSQGACLPGECRLEARLVDFTWVDSGVSGCPAALAEGGVSASAPVRALTWPPDTLSGVAPVPRRGVQIPAWSPPFTPPLGAERVFRESGSDPTRVSFISNTFHLWRGVDLLPEAWVSRPGAEMQPPRPPP